MSFILCGLVADMTSKLAQLRASGLACEAAGAVSDAIAVYRQICGSRHALAQDHHELARLLAAAGDPGQAAEVYRGIAGRFLGSRDACCVAGSLLAAMGARDEAIVQFARAIALDPDCEDARRQLADLGIVEAQQVDLHCMRASLSGPGAPMRALSIWQQFRFAVPLRMARSYRKRKLWSRVIDCYAPILREVPTNVSFLMQVGHAWRELGENDAALPFYRRAILFAPRAFDHYLHLGHLLSALGRDDSALYAYLTAHMLNPGFEGAARQLRDARHRLRGQVHQDMELVARVISGEAHEESGASGQRSGHRHHALVETARDAFGHAGGARLIGQFLAGAIMTQDL